MNKKLVLENGMEFIGTGFGSNKEKICELVFNTSMVGYQEILSDPSYCEQFVVMSYPLIGNYGLTSEDYESKNYYLGGFIVKEYNDIPSNFRYTNTLSDVLKENNIPGISGIDTRYLVRIIRDFGSMKAMICDVDKKLDDCLAQIKKYNYPKDQVKKVSCKNIWYSKTKNPKYTIGLIDCGTKLNIVRKLNEYGLNVVILPYNTKSEELLQFNIDAILVSNGPGDPTNVKEVIKLIKELKGKLPIFGICLGHQLIALANGLQTYKMKFGHRGSNHPVKNLITNKIEITSQNHSYAVCNVSCNDEFIITHINLLDNEVEGIKSIKNYMYSVQYHPESAAGPEDSTYLFKEFIDIIRRFKEHA